MAPDSAGLPGPNLCRMLWRSRVVVARGEGVAIKRRISLRAHEASIRRWVSEGKNDAWIADALGTSPGSVQSFRSRRRIPAEARRGRRAGPGSDAEGAGRAGPRYEGVVERGAGGRVGLWVDPAVADDAVYRERWMGRGKVRVGISGGRIVVAALDGG